MRPEGLLVLTRDETLLEGVRRAEVDGAIYHVSTEGDLASHLLAGQTHIVLLDAAAVSSVEHLVSRLAAQFPELIIVVAAERAVQVALADPLSEGTVFRVVAPHVSAARLREVVHAAHALGRAPRHLARATGMLPVRSTRAHDALMLAAALLGGLLLLASCFMLQRPAGHSSAGPRSSPAPLHRPGLRS